MKKRILIYLFLYLFIGITAQQSYSTNKYVIYEKKKSDKWIPIALFATSIALDATGDAFNDNNQKLLGHSLCALSVGTLLVSPFITTYYKDKWWVYLISYTTIRAGLFNPIYNTTRGKPLFYRSDSDLFDKALKDIPPEPTFHVWNFSIGIILPLTLLE